MLSGVSGVDFEGSLAYSTMGAGPSAASLDQMFRPLDLTVSLVHAIAIYRVLHPLSQVYSASRSAAVCGRS
jgi:hypothetical protein